MRYWQRGTRGLILTAAAIGLLLAGCAEDQGSDDEAGEDPSEQEQSEDAGGEDGDGEDGGEDDGAQDDGAEDDQASGEGSDGDALEEDMLGGEDMEDPNENVEDGMYRGNGVALPVPEGWSLDPAAAQQGIVAASSEDGEQQMTARAIDTEEAEAAGGQSMDLDTLLDSVREQVEGEADTDEEVDLEGAERAHRLTFLELPAQQEGQPDSSATIVLASDEGDEVVGEFTYTAAADGYDEEVASRLVDEAGFDPDSEPPEMPSAQPAPEDGAGTEDGSGAEGGDAPEEDAGSDGGDAGEEESADEEG